MVRRRLLLLERLRLRLRLWLERLWLRVQRRVRDDRIRRWWLLHRPGLRLLLRLRCRPRHRDDDGGAGVAALDDVVGAAVGELRRDQSENGGPHARGEPTRLEKEKRYFGCDSISQTSPVSCAPPWR